MVLMEDFQGLTKTITNKLRSLLIDEDHRGRLIAPIFSEVRERLLSGPPMGDDIDEAEMEKEPEKEPPVVRRHRSR